MPASPTALLILPDPLLAGSGLGPVLSSTLADGLTPGVATPSADNEGGMSVSQSGNPTTKVDVTYRLCASGGIWNEATWAWKLSSETVASDEIGWRGENDARYFWGGHDPFSLGVRCAANMALAYLPLLGRECAYMSYQTGTSIQVAYRTVTTDWHLRAAEGAEAGSWAKDFILRTDTGQRLKGPDNGDNHWPFDVCTLPDGKLLCAIVSSDGRDVDLYMSEDGVTFAPVADQILARFSQYGIFTASTADVTFRMKTSGDYICMAFSWKDTENVSTLGANKIFIRTLVSSDRGASWKEVTTLTASFEVYTLTGSDASLFDIGGIEDSAGTFMLATRTAAARQTVAIHFRRGTEGWIANAALNVSTGAGSTGMAIACGRGPQWVYMFEAFLNAGGTHQISYFLIDPRNYDQTTGWWKTEQFPTHSGGAIWKPPHGIHLCNVGGNYLSWLSYTPNGATVTTALGTEEPHGTTYMRWGGWDKLPVEERDNPKMAVSGNPPLYAHQPALLRSATGSNPYSLAHIIWDSWMGEPAPASTGKAPSTTPWTRPTHQNVTSDWRSSRVKYTDVAAVNNQWINRYDEAIPTLSWAVETGSENRSSCMVEIEMRNVQGGSVAVSDTICRVKSYDAVTASGDCISLVVRFATTGFAVYDEGAAADIVSVTTLGLGTRYYQIRIGLLARPWDIGNTVSAAIWYRDVEAAGSAWVLAGTGTVDSTTLAHTDQWIEFGHETALFGAIRISEWRRVAVYGPHDGGATRVIADGWGGVDIDSGTDDDFVLDNLRGRLATHDRIHVTGNVYARWDGGGGFEGDEYDGLTDERYGPRNLFAIASPRVGFRSATPTSGTTWARVAYDAGWENSANRFRHNAFAMFGMSGGQAVVEYADDSAFASVTAMHTLSTTRWTAVVSTAKGNVIDVDYSGDTPDEGEEMSGLGVQAHYARLTALAAGGCSTILGRVYKVALAATRDGKRSLRTDAEDDLGTLVPAGSTFSIFSDRGVVLYDRTVVARYMRWTLADTTTIYDNQQRLGTPVFGTSYTFEVPMEWIHTDSEAPNVTRYRTKGATEWGYEEGPSQRVWQGRVVGDTTELRQKMRRYLRATSGYEVHPVVLVTDKGALLDPERIILGFLRSGAELSEYGMRYDDDRGRWLTVGDMKVSLDEAV